jgi:uncharacterized protein involved in exopolysaccharide biosynthesis
MIVFKRRWLILAVLFGVVSAVVLMTLRAPKMYEVNATLFVRQARADMPIAPTESEQVFVNRVSQEDLNSEIEVLKSRKLIESVVRTLTEEEKTDLGPASGDGENTISAPLSVNDEERKARFNALVFRILNGLDVSVVSRSNILRLSYRSTDPVWATRVVGTLTEQYLKQRTERYQSPQAVFFFEQQMNDAELRLKQHKQALEEFADEASITLLEGTAGSDSLAAQKEMVMRRLSELEGRLGDAEVEFEAKTRQVASLQEMLRNEPERLENPNGENLDPTVNEIQRALTVLRLERDRLLQDFKPDSRHVRDIDSQIKMAEDRLRQATEALGESDTESNIVYVELKGDLMRAEVSLEGTRAEVVSLREQITDQEAKLAPLNAIAFDLEILQRNARTAEADYLRYRKKHEDARISAAMDQERFVNVTVAQPAQMPLRSEPRKMARNLFLSVFIGLVGGVGLAFGKEMFLDRSFTTAEDLEKRLGIPHIASIPDGEMVG